METHKINSWLPVFPGFYNTIFEPDCEDEINHWREETENPNLDYYDLEWDYKEYENKIAIQACEFIESQLSHLFDIKIEMEEISSPREYNFYNDSINCIYTLSEDDLKSIHAYLIDNIEEFKDYLLRYKSCSGFISYYSHYVNDWLMDYWQQIKEHPHYLGSILEFIMQNEYGEDADLGMLYSMNDVYLSASIPDSIH